MCQKEGLFFSSQKMKMSKSKVVEGSEHYQKLDPPTYITYQAFDPTMFPTSCARSRGSGEPDGHKNICTQPS
jgi:hypothetical protein